MGLCVKHVIIFLFFYFTKRFQVTKIFCDSLWLKYPKLDPKTYTVSVHISVFMKKDCLKTVRLVFAHISIHVRTVYT